MPSMKPRRNAWHKCSGSRQQRRRRGSLARYDVGCLSPREHDVAHERLFADYFAENPRWGPNVFHRRFRMSRDLFLRIVHTLEGRDEYFQYREDGIGRPGLTALQKCTVASRQLAYGSTADMFDEYLHVEDTTGRECLKKFCKLVVEAFGDTYLRRPTADDCQSLVRMHETVHGFPGMLGSINSGSNNDINVLNSSTLFVDQCMGRGPAIQFIANGRTHHMGPNPNQESARKDVERAFGVLQSRWVIVKGPARFWYKEVIADVMYACIIMHNMIVEQERGHVTNWVDDEAGSSSSTTNAPCRSRITDWLRCGSTATGVNAQPTRPYSAHDRHG
ncbi:uncharacterized protein LOC125220727 [Salvia hispanica]|uniref:uncharacterized protein LOC125220727 n=1 Tax=Salvia hispanica TaxID=49212 RepID=UPI0020091FAA|nr:uncharacterized protein LOC125220727 [Salvia hispanica]